MAVSQGQKIREHLREVFTEKGYDGVAERLLNDLEIFDSFHDFGSQNEYKAYKDICCSTILNRLAGARPNMGFLRSRGINMAYKGELSRTNDWDNSIENQIKRLYQNQVPEVLRLNSSGRSWDQPMVTISVPQILRTPEILSTLQFSSVTITQTDIDLNIYQKQILGYAILKYMFGVPNRAQGVFFTNDASVSITRDLFIDFNDSSDKGFFVGQLITPQNVCDSATSSTNEGFYKDKSFTQDVHLIDEGSSKNRVRYLFNLEDNTSNFFSQAFSTFELKKLEDKQFGPEFPYAFNYRILLQKERAATVASGIKFNTDDTYKKGKDGPSVSYLKRLIDDKEPGATPSAPVNELLIAIGQQYSAANFIDKKNRILFDIKRSGDHEQANALWLFNNTEHNIHYGIFQTLDILSALYSRILGNPTIFTSTSKSMQIYKGAAQMPASPLDVNMFKLAGLLGQLNRILGVYFSLITVLDSAPINRLIENLNKRSSFVHKDEFIKYCVMIKAADAVYSIQQMQKDIVYDFNNNNNAAENEENEEENEALAEEVAEEVAEGADDKAAAEEKVNNNVKGNRNILDDFFENIKGIYALFNQEVDPENILEGFNIVTPNFGEITNQMALNYVVLLEEFFRENQDSFDFCEAVLQHFNQKKIVTTNNGIVTTLNIQENFFLSSANGAVIAYVDSNDVIGFKKDQIKTDAIFNKNAEGPAKLKQYFRTFISSLMSNTIYQTTEPFTTLFENLDNLYIPEKKAYRTNVINNFCRPFLAEIERLITLQTGGAPNTNNNKMTFLTLLNNSVECVKKLVKEENAKKDFQIIVQRDITKYELVQIYNEPNKTSTFVTKEQQYRIISQTLFKLNAMIRKYSAVEYFTEQDINVMGGPFWIASTFIDVAIVFIDMYLELDLDKLDSMLENNLTNFYTYIFLPLSLKYQSMYNKEYEDFDVQPSAFSDDEILKMKLTLQVFGTRLPSGVDYDTNEIVKITNYITRNFKSLTNHNVNTKTTSIFGGRKKTQRRRSGAKTKSKISKVRRSTRYLKKKNK